MGRTVLRNVVLAGCFASANAWASMIAPPAQVGVSSKTGHIGAMAPGRAPGPGPSRGPAASPERSFDPSHMPSVDELFPQPVATPKYEPTYFGGEKKKGVDASEPCMDYVWDSNGIMSYVQVPCPTPNYMDEPEGTATPMLTPEEAAKAEKEPVTTTPTTVGAPLTGCYELDSAPPQGYVHKESNLEFNVARGGVPAVTYEVNTEHLAILTCAAPPVNKFSQSEFCDGGACDTDCHLAVPPKCNSTASSFGVCAPTVDGICDLLDNSATACDLAAQKVVDATNSYNKLDVDNSPCKSTIFDVTKDAHESYRLAYDSWVYAYNNASHACKVGAAIRDYNGIAFVQHHQNMDNIQKVSEMVCNAEEFDFEAAAAAAQPNRKLLQVSNNQTCAQIQDLIEQIKADTDLASRQIQCFASECVNTRALENYKFQELLNSYYIYNKTLSSYKAAVVGYNSAVADKYTKKAAAEEAFGVFNPVKGSVSDKFHGDLETYMTFASGAAAGTCGLTDCEMTAVCSYEMQNKFSDYVTKSEQGCVRNEKPLVELCKDRQVAAQN